MNTETREGLSTADLVPERTSSRQIDPVREEPQVPQDGMRAGAGETEQLAALFPPDAAQGFRQHWDQVQIGFVDDPQAAVRQADELVAQVMAHLARSFAEQRKRTRSSCGRRCGVIGRSFSGCCRCRGSTVVAPAKAGAHAAIVPSPLG